VTMVMTFTRRRNKEGETSGKYSCQIVLSILRNPSSNAKEILIFF